MTTPRISVPNHNLLSQYYCPQLPFPAKPPAPPATVEAPPAPLIEVPAVPEPPDGETLTRPWIFLK